MNIEQRDKILKLARKQYQLVGCVFPEDNRKMVEYLSESNHPDERRCILIAIAAHNVYNDDNLDESQFYNWHGV